jgi:hypothetical protein
MNDRGALCPSAIGKPGAKTIAQNDVKITVSDPSGIQARMALPGVTMFELAMLCLSPSSRTSAVGESGRPCGSPCSPAE